MSQGSGIPSAFRRGKEGMDWAQNDKAYVSRGPSRFFLNPGQSATLVFLDSEGFFLREHNVKINGKWGNHFTCIRDFARCGLCAGQSGKHPGSAAFPIAAFSAINLTGYIKDDGTAVKNYRQLVTLNKTVVEKFFRKMQEKANGDCKLWAVRFTRDSKNEAQTGEDIEFIKPVPYSELIKIRPSDVTPEAFTSPFPYEEIFALKTPEELDAIARQAWGDQNSALSVPGMAAPTQRPVQDNPLGDLGVLSDLGGAAGVASAFGMDPIPGQPPVGGTIPESEVDDVLGKAMNT